jgi:hypothetical protein
MNEKPLMSLYGASNRPQFWLWFDANIKHNEVPYEIIWTGDVRPTFELPPHMKFIFTAVKVAQCAHIAAKYCSGDLMLHVGDDLEFQPQALDELYKKYVEMNNYKAIIWSKMGRDGKDDTDYSIQSGHGVLMSRKFYLELGGYDRRFYCNTYDVDLQFRALSDKFNGCAFFADNAFMYERKDLCPGGWLRGGWYRHGGIKDVAFMQSLWFDEHKRRLHVPTSPEELFEDNDTLLTISQGTGAETWDSTHRVNE